MPWGWECKAKLVKQLPAKPTKRRGEPSGDAAPGPQQYEMPELFGGKGHDHIKRAPAYTFGIRPPISTKTCATPNAKIFNVRGITKKGVSKIPGGVVGTQLETLGDTTRKPGPAAYAPGGDSRHKRTPAYTCQPPARPPYQAWDMWTCPPNMYYPYVPFKKPPAFSIGTAGKSLAAPDGPGPGAHDPNFSSQQKSRPAYTFGYPFRPEVPPEHPPPNHYCEKKFMVSKRRAPAPSFGIRHTPFLGEFPASLKPSTLDLVVNHGMSFKHTDYSPAGPWLSVPIEYVQLKSRVLVAA